MGLFDLMLKTAVRVAVLPVAVVHDVATMGGACNDSKSMVGRIVKDTVDDTRKLLDKTKGR